MKAILDNNVIIPSEAGQVANQVIEKISIPARFMHLKFRMDSYQ